MQTFKSALFAVAAFACCLHACSAAEEPSAPAQYEFAYAVNDPVTGDQKDQREARNGDDVTGYYRLVDADGYLRTVNYKSDAVNGFTAQVVREPVNGGAAVVQKAVPAAAPATVAPYVAPAPYKFGPASAYPYAGGYQPYPYAGGYQAYPYAGGYQAYPYAGGYQPYPYAGGYQSYPYYSGYAPYGSFGRFPYSSQYPYNSQYPFSSPYVLRK